MPDLAWPWIFWALALPLAAGAMTFVIRRPVALWRVALVATAGAAACMAGAASAFHQRGGDALADPAWRSVLGVPVFFVDAVSALLLPTAALIWTAAVLVSPRHSWQPATLRRLLLGQALVLATLATAQPLVLVALMAGGALVLLRGIHTRVPAPRQTTRVFVWPGLVAPVLMAGGWLALHAAADPATILGVIGFGALLAAVWVRAGLFPFHAWVPHVLERAPLGAVVPLGACQMGAYAFLRLVVPHAPAGLLVVAQGTGLATALLAAGAAVVQRSARRALGYLMLAQGGLVVAGLSSATHAGVIGGLLFMVSSGLGLAGLGLTLRVLESRRGGLALDKFHGGYERMPHLAWTFLLFGLALSGLPGTLGFASEEVLLGALAEEQAVGAIVLVIVSMLTGVAVVRMYFALFCGRSSDVHDPQPLRLRERVGVLLLAVTLVAGGILPDRLVAVAKHLPKSRLPESRLPESVRTDPG